MRNVWEISDEPGEPSWAREEQSFAFNRRVRVEKDGDECAIQGTAATLLRL